MKLERWAWKVVKKSNDTFSHFYTMHKYDRETDSQTDERHTLHLQLMQCIVKI